MNTPEPFLPASEAEALEFLRSEFPKAEFKRAVLNPDGWDNLVVEVDGEWIFRFPRDDEYRFEQEQRVLTALRDRVRVAIPRVEYLGQSRGMMGYRKIYGRHVPEGNWASWPDERIQSLSAELAGFIWDCHRAISVEQAKSWGLPKQGFTACLSNLLDRTQELTRLGLGEFMRMALDEFGKLGCGERASFLYNDLHPENFVVDENCCLSGVFDFGDCRWGDPDWEFSKLYRYDRRLFESCVAEYERFSGLPISKRACVVYSWMDSLTDLAELWDRPDNGGHRNARRWIGKFMNTLDDYQ